MVDLPPDGGTSIGFGEFLLPDFPSPLQEKEFPGKIPENGLFISNGFRLGQSPSRSFEFNLPTKSKNFEEFGRDCRSGDLPTRSALPQNVDNYRNETSSSNVMYSIFRNHSRAI